MDFILSTYIWWTASLLVGSTWSKKDGANAQTVDVVKKKQVSHAIVWCLPPSYIGIFHMLETNSAPIQLFIPAPTPATWLAWLIILQMLITHILVSIFWICDWWIHLPHCFLWESCLEPSCYNLVTHISLLLNSTSISFANTVNMLSLISRIYNCLIIIVCFPSSSSAHFIYSLHTSEYSVRSGQIPKEAREMFHTWTEFQCSK